MLPSCWEIKKCGREKGGNNEKAFGVCPAFPDHGHSCWIVAGTFCKGEIQGTFSKNQRLCGICEVYQQYSTFFGKKKEELKRQHPEEFAACQDYFMRERTE